MANTSYLENRRPNKKKGQFMMKNGRNWSASTSTKGSSKKGYWITPKSLVLLDNIQKMTGYGSSDIINDAIALLNYELVNQESDQLSKLSARIGLQTVRFRRNP